MPEKPIVSFSMPRLSDGLAEGVISVTPDPSDLTADTVRVYWAGHDCRPLCGRNCLARSRADGFSVRFEDKIKITSYRPTGRPTVIRIPKNLLVPEGAAGLLVEAGAADMTFVPFETEPGRIAPGRKVLEFQAVSDLHLNTESGGGSFPKKIAGIHAAALFEDIPAVSPESIGVMVAGDLTNHGFEGDYNILRDLCASAPAMPPFYCAMGDHDYGWNLPDPDDPPYRHFFGEHPLYYDRWLSGYHFIFLSYEKEGSPCPIPEEELVWLRGKLAENAVPSRPIFLFCHGAVRGTVTGSAPEEGWWGIENGDEVGRILAGYPQAILFSGHSHYETSSPSEIYLADARMCSAVNTASVAYLWTPLDTPEGEYLEGSEGIYAEVYESGDVLIRCRDIMRRTWIAEYIIYAPCRAVES